MLNWIHLDSKNHFIKEGCDKAMKTNFMRLRKILKKKKKSYNSRPFNTLEEKRNNLF